MSRADIGSTCKNMDSVRGILQTLPQSGIKFMDLQGYQLVL